MMRSENDYLISDLLASWHEWASGWSDVAAHGSCAMFTGVRSSRQWDSANDVVDGSLHNDQMKALDFIVMEMDPIHRTAIQIKARNLATGVNVWSSPRLPKDPEERAVLMLEAVNALTKRMFAAGMV
jgi:hypothetical protein